MGYSIYFRNGSHILHGSHSHHLPLIELPKSKDLGSWWWLLCQPCPQPKYPNIGLLWELSVVSKFLYPTAALRWPHTLTRLSCSRHNAVGKHHSARLSFQSINAVIIGTPHNIFIWCWWNHKWLDFRSIGPAYLRFTIGLASVILVAQPKNAW